MIDFIPALLAIVFLLVLLVIWSYRYEQDNRRQINKGRRTHDHHKGTTRRARD